MTVSEEPSPKIKLSVTFEGQSVTFSTKREKPLVKMFDAFADQFNLECNTLRFLTSEGVRIRAEQTPAELDLDEGEEISAVLFQQGGSFTGTESA